jgi:hypothetical protein
VLVLPFSFRRTLLLLVVLFMAGGTTGCATAFLYDRADRFANRWVGGYVALGAPRQAALESGLAELHAWHRREQLPVYAEWLRATGVRLDASAPFSAGELQEYGAELGRFWRSVADTALPLAIQLGASLDDAEVSELIATLRERHDKEYAAAARRAASWHEQRRARSMERMLRRWTGRLTEDQRAGIAAWSRGLEPSRAAISANRRGWIDELEAALARRDETEQLSQAAHALFVTPSGRWSPEYQGIVERNSSKTAEFLAEFLNGLEERQRATAVERILRLAEQLEELSRPTT